MSIVGTHNFEILQGETWTRTLTWKISGALVDLTGYTARMQVRRKVTSDSTLLSLTSGSGITLGGSAGTITLSVSATDTAAMTWREGKYDLELVASDGTVTRLLEGRITVDPEVTR